MLTLPATLLLLLPMPVAAQTPPARPAQIILFRHAEKPDDPGNPHLSPAGVRRAERLVSFMTTNRVVTRFGPPVALFATHQTRHDNGVRTQETDAPLGRALNLPVQTPYLASDYAALARQILGDPAYAGKTVIICWTHSEIPRLAAALGVVPRPPKWNAGVFDRVYVISWVAGRAVLTQVSQ